MNGFVRSQAPSEHLCHDVAMFQVGCSTADQPSVGRRNRYDSIAMVDVADSLDRSDRNVCLHVVRSAVACEMRTAHPATARRSTAIADRADVIASSPERLVSLHIAEADQAEIVAVAEPRSVEVFEQLSTMHGVLIESPIARDSSRPPVRRRRR